MHLADFEDFQFIGVEVDFPSVYVDCIHGDLMIRCVVKHASLENVFVWYLARARARARRRSAGGLPQAVEAAGLPSRLWRKPWAPLAEVLGAFGVSRVACRRCVFSRCEDMFGCLIRRSQLKGVEWRPLLRWGFNSAQHLIWALSKSRGFNSAHHFAPGWNLGI